MQQPNQPNEHRKQPRRPSLSATRERLAFTLILLFTIISLAVVFVPGGGAAQHIVPFVASMLALVVSFYFKRRERE
jgi:membrane associated rhomboid family serine protease